MHKSICFMFFSHNYSISLKMQRIMKSLHHRLPDCLFIKATDKKQQVYIYDIKYKLLIFEKLEAVMFCLDKLLSN